jgi:L-alanine-DL-glutamate epimerase-like enolase superfamily enzyme
MGDRCYDLRTVHRLAEDLKEYHPVWLEEPLPPDDHAAYRDLRSRSGVKIASGEHEPDDAGFLDLISSGAADYVQMDILCQGGVSSARRIFEKVAEKNLRFAFHSWGTELEVLAAAQLGACWPEDVVEWLEYPCYAKKGFPVMYPFPLAGEILRDPLRIEEGSLILPDGPGLGLEINEGVIERYPYIPGPWSLFRLDSPPGTVAVTGDHSVKWTPA